MESVFFSYRFVGVLASSTTTINIHAINSITKCSMTLSDNLLLSKLLPRSVWILLILNLCNFTQTHTKLRDTMSKIAAIDGVNSIHWFRKGLRLHDSPALVEACTKSRFLYPVFIMDPNFTKPDKVGINRYNFLLQSLDDLDQSLKAIGSRLFVLRGRPEEQLPLFVKKWDIKLLTFESDTGPYAKCRDEKIIDLLSSSGVVVHTSCSHTLFDPNDYIVKCKGNVPTSYQSFCKLFSSMGNLRAVANTIAAPDIPPFGEADVSDDDSAFDVPKLKEMGYEGPVSEKFPGGETEALRRLHEMVTSRPDWVAAFEKPNTSPNSLEPSTTVLSPYLKFGCLSPTLFYHTLASIYRQRKHTEPPVSLHGQLLWREFFYLSSVATPQFHKMKGNPRCKQIPWGDDPALVLVWKEGRTGYPFIDAIMTQLRVEGWIHHLARHAVACFLTRGDLWQSWEAGVKVFDLYLLDADYALNNANWQWLSCSNFFFQFFRVYSPVAFGKKTDPNGDYIRKWVPALARYPTKYIYEPWKAPAAVQADCGCVLGVDYPHRVVIHEEASKENMAKMKAAYAAQRESGEVEEGVDGNGGGGTDAGVAGDRGVDSSSSSSSSGVRKSGSGGVSGYASSAVKGGGTKASSAGGTTGLLGGPSRDSGKRKVSTSNSSTSAASTSKAGGEGQTIDKFIVKKAKKTTANEEEG